MEAFYDLAQSPATHDFVFWLAQAEYMRRDGGDKTLTVRFVPGNRQFSDRDLYYTPERRNWRIDNLLIPLAWLVPSVIDASRGKGVQTWGYTPAGMVFPPIFKAPKLAREIVDKLIPKNAVTISLRTSDFEPSRNSRHEEWVKVAGWLRDKGLTPIFVPDAEADMRGTSPNLPFPEYLAASHNFALRLALYERARLNLITVGGPFATCLLSDVPMMGFKMHVPGLATCTKDHLRKVGIAPESDWSTLANRKQTFWEDDTAEFIIPAVEKRLKDEEDRVKTTER